MASVSWNIPFPTLCELEYPFSYTLCCKRPRFARFVLSRKPLYAVVTKTMATNKLPPPWASKPGGNVNFRINGCNGKVSLCAIVCSGRPVFQSSVGTARANVNMIVILTLNRVRFKDRPQVCRTPLNSAIPSTALEHIKQVSGHCTELHEIYGRIL
jgi:hypothetical protein